MEQQILKDVTKKEYNGHTRIITLLKFIEIKCKSSLRKIHSTMFNRGPRIA